MKIDTSTKTIFKNTIALIFVISSIPFYNTKPIIAQSKELLTDIKWSSGLSIGHSYILNIQDGIILGSIDSELVCIDASSGKVLWHYNWDVHILSTAYAYKDKVYFFSRYGTVLVLFKTNGCFNKFIKLVISTNILFTDRHLVYANANVLNKFNLDTERIDYSFNLPISVSKIILSNNDLIVTSNDGFVARADLSQNKILWSKKLLPEGTARASMNDKRLLVGIEKSLICIDTDQGVIIWQNNDVYKRNIIFGHDMIFYGQNCFDIKNGKLLWMIDDYNGNSIYIDGYLYVYNICKWKIYNVDNGELVFTGKASIELYHRAIIWGNLFYLNDCIYVPLTDGKIYCYSKLINKIRFMVGIETCQIDDECIDLNIPAFIESSKVFVDVEKIFEPLGCRFVYIKNYCLITKDWDSIGTIFPVGCTNYSGGKGIIIHGFFFNKKPSASLEQLAELIHCKINKDNETGVYTIER